MKQFKLRLPDDLHAQLVASASVSGRSLTGEIIWRLRENYRRGSIRDDLRAVLDEQRPASYRVIGDSPYVERMFPPFRVT